MFIIWPIKSPSLPQGWIKKMSRDERIYQQIEELSSFIIKALESLEKELSEYINVTDQRLQTLEDKVQNLESLTDVAGKGLLKAMEDKSKKESKPSTLPKKTSKQSEIIRQPTPESFEGIEKKNSAEGRTVERKREVISEIPQPPVPQTIKPSSIKEERKNQGTQKIKAPTPPTSEPATEKKGKQEEKKGEESIIEDEKDREELMSALKIIDSL